MTFKQRLRILAAAAFPLILTCQSTVVRAGKQWSQSCHSLLPEGTSALAAIRFSLAT